VDSTIDAIVFEGEVPLSVKEIQQLKGGLAARTRWGLGRKFQDSNPFISQWVDQVFDPGICFNSRTIWYRTDFLSNPEFSPPWHGTTAYCETGIIIEKEDLSRDLGMFPWQLESQDFDLPPQKFPGLDKNRREAE